MEQCFVMEVVLDEMCIKLQCTNPLFDIHLFTFRLR